MQKHEEYQYLDLLEEISRAGVKKPNRTEQKTISVFGRIMKFSLTRNENNKQVNVIPLITTKFTPYKTILKELFFFISGKTNVKLLQAAGVHIWDQNAADFAKRKNPTIEGDLGPIYSHQYRHFGAPYIDCNTEYGGIDQINKAIQTLKNDPFNRRIIVSAWNPEQIEEMALPPCHILYHFNVDADDNLNPRYLNCLVYQRSADLPLGIPFNLASYATLTHLVAKLTNLTPNVLTYVLGDAHIYENQLDLVPIQLQREPYPFPTIEIEECDSIDDYDHNKIKLINYKYHPHIKYPFTV